MTGTMSAGMSEGMPAVAADEMEDMRATIAAFLDDAAPMARVREVMAGQIGYDDVLWQRLRDELGLGGAAVPERCGGLGLGFADGTVLLREFARRLTPVPFAELLVASALLDALGSEAADAMLGEMAESASLVAIAGADPTDALPAVSAGPDGWTLTGRLRYIPFGHVAEVLLLAAEGPDGPAVYALRGAAAGVSRAVHQGLDTTRPLAEILAEHAPVQRVSRDSGGPSDVATLRNLVLATQAAEAAASAAAALEMTVEYLKVREQFGRPIGSFQALKHRCADHAVTVAGARSTARHAALAADAELSGGTGEEPLSVLAPLAKAVCADAFFTVAADAIQLHGGIGFTFEHDAHLYFKRAKSTQHLYGHPDALRAGLATAAGL